MTKKLLTLATLATIVTPVGAAWAQDASWVHVHVEEDERTVARLNLPASMVEVALDAIRSGHLDGMRPGRGNGDFQLDDARRMWRAMRDAGDAEFVDVQDGDERIRVFREGDRVHVQVHDGDEESAVIEMPVEVADVLLGEPGEDLDLAGAVRALARRGETDLLRIRGPDGTVRVWVDRRSDQAG